MQTHKILTFLFALLLGILLSPNSGWKGSDPKSVDEEYGLTNCPEGILYLDQAPGSPVEMIVLEAKCGDFFSNVRLRLTNISDKDIRAYDVYSIEDYENKKCVISGTGGSGIIAKKGEPIEISSGVSGFEDGLSYGKPVGKLQRVVFKVTSIGFVDGTTWTPENPGQENSCSFFSL